MSTSYGVEYRTKFYKYQGWVRFATKSEAVAYVASGEASKPPVSPHEKPLVVRTSDPVNVNWKDGRVEQVRSVRDGA